MHSAVSHSLCPMCVQALIQVEVVFTDLLSLKPSFYGGPLHCIIWKLVIMRYRRWPSPVGLLMISAFFFLNLRILATKRNMGAGSPAEISPLLALSRVYSSVRHDHCPPLAWRLARSMDRQKANCLGQHNLGEKQSTDASPLLISQSPGNRWPNSVWSQPAIGGHCHLYSS